MNNVSDEHSVLSINIHPSFYTFLFPPFRIFSSFFAPYTSPCFLFPTFLMQHPMYNHSPTLLEIYWNVWFDKKLLHYILPCLPYKIQNYNKIHHACITRSNFKHGLLNYYGYFSTLNISEVENLFLWKMLWKIKLLSW